MSLDKDSNEHMTAHTSTLTKFSSGAEEGGRILLTGYARLHRFI